ncbi:unnamed protein product [Lampetra planeri]
MLVPGLRGGINGTESGVGGGVGSGAVRQVPAKWIESGRQRPGSVARREREGNFVRNRLDGVEDAFDWSELQLPGRLGADGCLYLCSMV